MYLPSTYPMNPASVLYPFMICPPPVSMVCLADETILSNGLYQKYDIEKIFQKSFPHILLHWTAAIMYYYSQCDNFVTMKSRKARFVACEWMVHETHER